MAYNGSLTSVMRQRRKVKKASLIRSVLPIASFWLMIYHYTRQVSRSRTLFLTCSARTHSLGTWTRCEMKPPLCLKDLEAVGHEMQCEN
jgi:hypothetical protein